MWFCFTSGSLERRRVSYLWANAGKSFWEVDPVECWDVVNHVGLRNHFVCTSLAARLMVQQSSGIIVNVSSMGGIGYVFNVPYGVGKCAVDRMAADCAHEVKGHNVAVMSLWPGPVKTEKLQKMLLAPDATSELKEIFSEAETPELSGKAIVKLVGDPNVMKKTGKILTTSGLSLEYNITEDDGTLPAHIFSLKKFLIYRQHNWLAALVPSFVRIPKFLVHFASYKF